MLDILDEANKPVDMDETTELPASSSPASTVTSVVHTKLGSPKPKTTTLKEFMEVSTGPGNPVPRVFQGKLEAFLNNFCMVNQLPHAQYLKLQGDNKVIGFISIVCGLLTRAW
jgi:hypothetical protein